MKTHRAISFPTFLLLLLLALMPTFLLAQSHCLSGTITDGKSRKPLAFVNVVVNDGHIGGISDIDGKYEIKTDEPVRKVKFSSLGYATEEIELPSSTKIVDVALRPITFELKEAVVEAGENPAHRIIDSLMAHRKANNPDALGAYRYKIYDRMVFTVDSSELERAVTETKGMGSIHEFDSLLKQSDLMVMETASEVLFKAPDRKLQNVLGTKVAGMKNPTFIYLVNSLQSISFYDERIHLAGTDYINPISRGSKAHYSFHLEAVEPIGRGDSLYVVSFHPKNGSTFNGLRGTLIVNSDGWALQSVKAAPNEQGSVFTIDIQQLYQKIGSQWFPTQLNTNLKFPNLAVDVDGYALTMVAIGKSYLSDIEIHPDISSRQFSDIEIKVDPKAAYRNEDFWTDHRIDSLTERTLATYILIDSLTRDNHLLDRVMGLTDKLMYQSALSFGPFNLNLDNVIKLSARRGWYFGLDFSTNERFSPAVSLDVFGGYWTRAKLFDYGGGLTWHINPQRQMDLSLNCFSKSESLGGFGDIQENGNVLEENNYKYEFYENVHSRKNSLELQYTTRFARYFKGFLNLSMSHKHYSPQLCHTLSDTLTEGLFANAEVKLRFAYKEKFLSRPDGLRSLGTVYPIVWFSYLHSFPNLLGSQFDYDILKMEASQNLYTSYLGVAKIVLQMGYATESCPMEEVFNVLGTYEPFGLYSPGSFSTMREDEFFCDRFVGLYLSHNFNGMLWKTRSKWFKPELTLVTNLGWGDLRRAHTVPEKNFKTMEKGYFESGFVVKGLINLPLVKLGLGAFYRYGPYAFDRVWDNFALKWSATFSL